MVLPDGPNQRRSLAFVFDSLICGLRVRALCVVDDQTREYPARTGNTSLRCLGCAGTDQPDGHPQQATYSGQRQWQRPDLVGHPALVAGAKGRAALHRAVQANAERLRGEPQRPPAGREPQRDPVHLAGPCPACAGRAAARLQHGEATLETSGKVHRRHKRPLLAAA